MERQIFVGESKGGHCQRVFMCSEDFGWIGEMLSQAHLPLAKTDRTLSSRIHVEKTRILTQWNLLTLTSAAKKTGSSLKTSCSMSHDVKQVYVGKGPIAY